MAHCCAWLSSVLTKEHHHVCLCLSEPFYLFGSAGVKFFSQSLQLLLSDECITLENENKTNYIMIHHNPTFDHHSRFDLIHSQKSLKGPSFGLPWKLAAIVTDGLLLYTFHQQLNERANKLITWQHNNHFYCHQSVCTKSLTWLKEESLSGQFPLYWRLAWLCCFSLIISSFLIWPSSNLLIKDSTTMFMVCFKVCIICWYLKQTSLHCHAASESLIYYIYLLVSLSWNSIITI